SPGGIEVFQPRPLGALLAALIAVPSAGQAQTVNALDPYLMRPQLDGDPRNPPRFSRTVPPGLSRGFAYQPGRGAGTSGSHSSAQRPKAQPGRRLVQVPLAATEESAIGPPALRPTQGAAQNQKQGLKQNPGQQPRAATSANAAYLVGPLVDPPALPARRRLMPDEDFFAPTGLHAGTFLLRPAVETSVGYDSNPARSATGKSSWFAVAAPALLASSNWSRHELTATIRGSYTDYESASSLNRPSLDARVDGRVDVTPLTRVDLETRVIVGTDNPGSPNIQAGLAKLPIYTTVGGTAGLGQRFNRVDVTLKGGADRTVYEQST